MSSMGHRTYDTIKQTIIYFGLDHLISFPKRKLLKLMFRYDLSIFIIKIPRNWISKSHVLFLVKNPIYQPTTLA